MEPAALREREDARAKQRARLCAALSELDERSKAVLQSRWLAQNKMTLRELAQQFGVAAERIRQIETNALRKLRLQRAL